MSDQPTAASPPPKKKKLPFKPTALRRTATPKSTSNDDKKSDDGDGGLGLFRRREEMAPILAAEQEERLRKNKHKQKRREAKRRTSSPGQEQSHDGEDGRPNVSQALDTKKALELMCDVLQVENGFDGVYSDTSPVAQDASQDAGFRHRTSYSSTKSWTRFDSEPATPPPLKRSRFGSTSPARPSSETPLSVKAESMMDASPSKPRFWPQPRSETPMRRQMVETKTLGGAPLIILDSDSEPDVKEEAGAKLGSTARGSRDASLGIIKEVLPGPSIATAENDEFSEYIRQAEEKRARESKVDGSQEREHTNVLVSSPLPGSKTIRVKFPFDKSFVYVRKAWIKKQQSIGIELPPNQHDEIILTWRRKKVYNYSTLTALGIRPQDDGKLLAEGRDQEGIDKDQNEVYIEAWTPELFREMEQQEEQQRRREAGEISDGDESSPEAKAEPEIKLRVILKARKLEDVKFTVRQETTVETLITGFRTKHDLGNDRDVSLWFDGERLEEHTTMESAEIDDLDVIEVHIK